ncbi:MAG: nucleotidyl transferase AbiEii/AbiGii toxin family protein [Acidimicrobiia bacterium]|nr:nucleotidyl transferase AbiEii/AbiGii toxin family protein [Acidimicrobiia bacterium]
MTGRPRGAKEFQRLLQRHATEISQLPQRVMHLVRVGVVCAMLDETRHPDGGHLFVVKGGTAMQLRLGIRARATTDLDIVFAGRVEEWLTRFDAATMDRSWNGFTVTRKAPPTHPDRSEHRGLSTMAGTAPAPLRRPRVRQRLSGSRDRRHSSWPPGPHRA